MIMHGKSRTGNWGRGLTRFRSVRGRPAEKRGSNAGNVVRDLSVLIAIQHTTQARRWGKLAFEVDPALVQHLRKLIRADSLLTLHPSENPHHQRSEHHEKLAD